MRTFIFGIMLGAVLVLPRIVRAESLNLREVKAGAIFSGGADDVSGKSCAIKVLNTKANIQEVGMEVQILIDGQEYKNPFWIYEYTTVFEYRSSSEGKVGSDSQGNYSDLIVARLAQGIGSDWINFYLANVRIREEKVIDHSFKVKCLGLRVNTN